MPVEREGGNSSERATEFTKSMQDLQEKAARILDSNRSIIIKFLDVLRSTYSNKEEPLAWIEILDGLQQKKIPLESILLYIPKENRAAAKERFIVNELVFDTFSIEPKETVLPRLKERIIQLGQQGVSIESIKEAIRMFYTLAPLEPMHQLDLKNSQY